MNNLDTTKPITEQIAAELLRCAESAAAIKIPDFKRQFFQIDLDDDSGPSRQFLKHLREMLKVQVTEKALAEAVKKARAMAGGKMSGRKRKRAKESTTMSVRAADEYGSVSIDPSFLMGPRLAKEHAAVKYKQSDVDPEEVRAGTAAPYEDQERCGTCRYYRYSKCQLVEGSIDAYFVCGLYEGRVREFKEGVKRELMRECSDDGGDMRLFFELREFKATEKAEWIPYLPTPGTYFHRKWGEINLTPERNRHFVEQFDKRVYGQDLPIDIEHSVQLDATGKHVVDDTTVIAGYVKKLRSNSDGSVDAFVEFTKDGVKTLSEGSRRYFSPQWLEAYQDPATRDVHTDVAIGGALTSRPFFKERHLRPLVASEHALAAMSFSEKPDATESIRFVREEKQMDPKDTQKASNAETSEGFLARFVKAMGFSGSESEEEIKAKLPKIQASDDDDSVSQADGDSGNAGGSDPGVVISASELDAYKKLENQNKELRSMTEKQEKESKKMSERLEKLETQGLERRFRDIIAGNDPEKGTHDSEAVWLGDPEMNLKHLMRFSEVYGADSQEVKDFIKEKQDEAVNVATSRMLSEIGSERGADLSGSAYGALETKAKEIHEKGDAKTFSEALELAQERNPALVERHTKEMRGR